MACYIELASALLVMVLASISTTNAKKELHVYTVLKPDAARWDYKFSETNRCYSFAKCLDEKAMAADWDYVKDSMAIAFYGEAECQGDKIVSFDVPKGQKEFQFNGLRNGAASFMVWGQGTYGTNGFEQKCLERSAVYMSRNSTRDTISSRSSSGSAEYVATEEAVGSSFG